MARFGEVPFLRDLDRTPRERELSPRGRRFTSASEVKQVFGIDLRREYAEAQGGVANKVAALWDHEAWRRNLIIDISRTGRLNWWRHYRLDRDEVGPVPYRDGYRQYVAVDGGFSIFDHEATNLPSYFFGAMTARGRAHYGLPLSTNPQRLRYGVSWRDRLDREPYYPATEADVEDLYTRFLGTNPLNRRVDVPAALTESLSEIVELIPVLGKSRAKRVVVRGLTRNLAWVWLLDKFVTQPILGDIIRLCQTVTSLEMRIRELQRLLDGRTVRKRLLLGRETRSQVQVPGATWSYAWPGLSGRVKVNFVNWSRETQVYAVGHWQTTLRGRMFLRRLVGSYEDVSNYQRLKASVEAMSVGFAGQSQVATVWELVPWSWLADYFVNLGEFLRATQNLVLAEPQGSITAHVVKDDRIDLNRATLTGFSGRTNVFVDVKETIRNVRPTKVRLYSRVPILLEDHEDLMPGLKFHGPFLSRRQAANLLAVLRLVLGRT